MSHKSVVHNHLHMNHNYTAIYIPELARESFWTFGIYVLEICELQMFPRLWYGLVPDVMGHDPSLRRLTPPITPHRATGLTVAGLPSWTRFFKSILQSVQTGCGAHPASSSTHTHLVSRIGMSGAIPPSPLRLYECTWPALLFSFFYAKVSTRNIFSWSVPLKTVHGFLSSLVWSASLYIVLSALAMFYCSFLPQELRTGLNRVGREAGRKKNKGRKGGGRTTERNI